MTMRSKLGASGRASPRVPPTALTPGNLCDDNPENVNADPASPGVSEQVSRCDHKHDVDTGVPVSVGSANAEGVASTLARSDHVHDGTTILTAVAPVNVTKAAAAVGVAATAARSDHKHDIDTAVPVDVGAANAEGTATSLARSDHVHALGADIVTVNNVDPIDSATNEGGPRLTFIIPWVGPGAGAGDATLFNANLPFKCRYVSAICLTTNIGAGTGGATIRTAAGGLGNQISTSMGTTTTATRTVDASGGIVLPNHTLAAGSSLFLRLTDGTAQGLLYVDVIRID